MKYVLYLPNEYNVITPQGKACVSLSRECLVVANKTSLSKNAYHTFEYMDKKLALVPYLGDGDELFSAPSLNEAKNVRRALFKKTRQWFQIYEYDGKEVRGCVA